MQFNKAIHSFARVLVITFSQEIDCPNAV